jgi:hypothetical protein
MTPGEAAGDDPLDLNSVSLADQLRGRGRSTANLPLARPARLQIRGTLTRLEDTIIFRKPPSSTLSGLLEY